MDICSERCSSGHPGKLKMTIMSARLAQVSLKRILDAAPWSKTCCSTKVPVASSRHQCCPSGRSAQEGRGPMLRHFNRSVAAALLDLTYTKMKKELLEAMAEAAGIEEREKTLADAAIWSK